MFFSEQLGPLLGRNRFLSLYINTVKRPHKCVQPIALRGCTKEAGEGLGLSLLSSKAEKCLRGLSRRKGPTVPQVGASGFFFSCLLCPPMWQNASVAQSQLWPG